MSIFECSNCGCIENTSTSNYWNRYMIGDGEPPPLCSECDPEIGKWHRLFEKQSAKGMLVASDGFLYSKEYTHSDNFKWREKYQGLKIVRVIE